MGSESELITRENARRCSLVLNYRIIVSRSPDLIHLFNWYIAYRRLNFADLWFWLKALKRFSFCPSLSIKYICTKMDYLDQIWQGHQQFATTILFLWQVQSICGEPIWAHLHTLQHNSFSLRTLPHRTCAFFENYATPTPANFTSTTNIECFIWYTYMESIHTKIVRGIWIKHHE